MGNGSPVQSRKTFSGLGEDKSFALSPNEYKAFRISKITSLKAKTKSFVLDLPSKEDETGLRPASYLMIKGLNSSSGKVLFAGHTPEESSGSFELVIKANKKCPTSMYLHTLQVGDFMEVKGPLDSITVKSNVAKTSIGMITNGPDLENVFEVLNNILKHSDEIDQINLLCSNENEFATMINHQTLNDMSIKHSILHITYIVTRPSEYWKGNSGEISESLLREVMPAASEDTIIYVSGPSSFMGLICGMKTNDNKQGQVKGLLKNMGFSEENVLKL